MQRWHMRRGAWCEMRGRLSDKTPRQDKTLPLCGRYEQSHLRGGGWKKTIDCTSNNGGSQVYACLTKRVLRSLLKMEIDSMFWCQGWASPRGEGQSGRRLSHPWWKDGKRGWWGWSRPERLGGNANVEEVHNSQLSTARSLICFIFYILSQLVYRNKDGYPLGPAKGLQFLFFFFLMTYQESTSQTAMNGQRYGWFWVYGGGSCCQYSKCLIGSQWSWCGTGVMWLTMGSGDAPGSCILDQLECMEEFVREAKENNPDGRWRVSDPGSGGWSFAGGSRWTGWWCWCGFELIGCCRRRRPKRMGGGGGRGVEGEEEEEET